MGTPQKGRILIDVDDLRILIMGDDPLARNGLLMLLSGQPGIVVVGQAAPSDDLALAIQSHEPTVAVLDWGAKGPEALPELDLPFVAIVPDEDHAGDALTSGARGVLLRDAEPERLAAALRAVAHGLVVVDESLANLSRQRLVASPLLEELTPREVEVLQLLAQGLPNKSIAGRLGISEHTAKFHVNAILGKLGAETRTEAVVLAARLGLVAL
jgi:two-component system nitrate/nitrite response regulator NarL